MSEEIKYTPHFDIRPVPQSFVNPDTGKPIAEPFKALTVDDWLEAKAEIARLTALLAEAREGLEMCERNAAQSRMGTRIRALQKRHTAAPGMGRFQKSASVGKHRAKLLTQPSPNLEREMKRSITIEPITPKNSRFGSAPMRYWRHADFSRAFVDGFPEDWRLNEDSSKRHPDDYRWQYLKVPCHDQKGYPKGALKATHSPARCTLAKCPRGQCRQCLVMGWKETTHRLYYKGRRGKTLKAIRIGKLDGRWCWILTRAK